MVSLEYKRASEHRVFLSDDSSSGNITRCQAHLRPPPMRALDTGIGSERRCLRTPLSSAVRRPFLGLDARCHSLLDLLPCATTQARRISSFETSNRLSALA
ncbi:hypothetical protein E2562_024053 [Oryza meyeriana var. granulata]|uniref:Uncharacterized protein n=1 Tax=Oryza meyeriana var. granulata TaxID=110450 RepID=A0A6G1CSG5_9ORYZ|nr:hypothetical protein E2562_024053 [Oryza meyeriana var. granulata]